jgi:rod shape determining protein RodA
VRNEEIFNTLKSPRKLGTFLVRIYQRSHLDLWLLVGIAALIAFALLILYSATNGNWAALSHQGFSFLLALGIMIFLAQISPERYKNFAPWFFSLTLFLLLAVLVLGVISKGAQRWINLGWFHFQPSEMMKISMPMMLSWYLKDKNLPPTFKVLLISGVILLIPVLMIIKQPDLGTAIVIAFSGFFVLLLAGINRRFLISTGLVVATSLPILWHFLHPYQKERIITFLNPENDPLGSGYHIIQSKIAIGSGGFLGKGFMHGSQIHLQFLPEHSTDFIFGVCAEELGLIGCFILISIFLFIAARGLYISLNAQNTFSRLLAGSLILTFFISFFINIGMVIGILPVVGIPLPLVSYGGSSVVTILASFGIIMSIKTHKKLLSS